MGSAEIIPGLDFVADLASAVSDLAGAVSFFAGSADAANEAFGKA
ncbi:hypothetical protein ACWF62_16780 [Rhodococcus sp. NPDC054953]